MFANTTLYTYYTDIAPGLYMNALCYTLQDDILTDYEDFIVTLEQEIMMDQDMTLSAIMSRLQDRDYNLLFPAISQLLQDIQTRKVRSLKVTFLVTCNLNIVKHIK